MNITIGIADMKVSNSSDVTLVTYSLGSCIGVAIYDPVARVGGLLHYMLPDSSIDPNKASSRPFMFADTGIPLLFKATYRLGAKKSRIVVKVAGGAEIMNGSGLFNIGKRNYAALRKILWRNNVLIDGEDVGGNINRTIRLSIATGEVSLKLGGKIEKLL